MGMVKYRWGAPNLSITDPSRVNSIYAARVMDPAEVMPYAKNILDTYHGKDVWIVLGRTIPGGKDKDIYEYIRSLGHI